MKDEGKTKKQLIHELTAARSRIAKLEASGNGRPEAGGKQTHGTRRTGTSRADHFMEESVDRPDRFQAIFERTGIGIVITDPERRIVDCNPAFVKMLGYSQEELIGKTAGDVTYPDDEESNAQRFHEALAERLSGFRMEKRYIRKDGTILWGVLTLSFHYDEEGKPTLIVALVEDVTEQKLIDEALRIAQKRAEDERSRAEGILASIGDGISIQDRDFRVLYQNQAHKDQIGDHVGEYCYEAYEGRNSMCEWCPVAKSFSDGAIHSAERHTETNDGPLFVDITASPLRDASGDIVAGIEVVRNTTERKQAEEKLKAAKEEAEEEHAKAEAIIAAMGTGMSILDRHYIIQYQNSVHRDLTGDHVGQHCYQAYHGLDRICESCPVEMTFQDGNVHTMERAVTAEGGERHIEVTTSPLKDKNGSIVACIEVVRNITGRKLVEDSRAMLREAIESLPIGITITDLDGKVIYMNPAEAEIHGYTAMELIGKDARMLAPRDTWEPLSFEELHAMGIRKRESVNIRKDGRVFPVQLISRAVTNAQGTPIGIITACEDITARKGAERALRESEERYRSFVQNFQGIAYRGRMDFVPVFFHGAVEEITGYTEKEFLAGKPRWDQVIHPDDFPGLMDKIPDIRSVPDISIEREYRILRKDGQIRWVNELIQNICDHSGKPCMVQGALYDITERKEAEKKLRNAQRMEVIGNLAGGVAHEVRNPLNAIMAISEALARDLGENPEYKPFLEHIHGQVERLSALMRDLLDLGKPVDQFQFHEISLAEICSASIDIWKHTGSGNRCEARLVKPEGDGEVIVYADSRRLQQVFVNLLENAAQHSSEDTTIEMRLERPKRGMCGVNVVDRGSGIPDEYLPRIFEPFFSTRRGGTGLGMSIVRHVVETHGGAVKVMNNEPPPGCTVVVRLPEREKGAA